MEPGMIPVPELHSVALLCLEIGRVTVDHPVGPVPLSNEFNGVLSLDDHSSQPA